MKARGLMADTPTLLALDASSTTIGWVLYAEQVCDAGEILLTGDDIADRCRQAFAHVGLLLTTYPEVDALAIEAPVARFAKAVIPQARVSGAILACAAQRQRLVCEITPTKAKRALAGKGNAKKELMQARAAEYGITGEHAADALGVAIAASTMVEVRYE